MYLTGVMAGSENGLRIIQHWKQAGGNAVVFDIKDSDRSSSIIFDHPLAPTNKHVPLRNLPKFTRYLHSQGLHAIARIAIFRDEYLVTHHPELAIRSRRTGEPWKENQEIRLDRPLSQGSSELRHRISEIRGRQRRRRNSI